MDTPTKLKFELVDGGAIEFDEFTPNDGHIAYCYLPPLKPSGGARTQASYIYLSPEDYAVVSRNKTKTPLTPAELAKVRVGILRNTTSHPFPKGIYLPYTLDYWGTAEHALDKIYGDYVFNKTAK